MIPLNFPLLHFLQLPPRIKTNEFLNIFVDKFVYTGLKLTLVQASASIKLHY